MRDATDAQLLVDADELKIEIYTLFSQRVTYVGSWQQFVDEGIVQGHEKPEGTRRLTFECGRLEFEIYRTGSGGRAGGAWSNGDRWKCEIEYPERRRRLHAAGPVSWAATERRNLDVQERFFNLNQELLTGSRLVGAKDDRTLQQMLRALARKPARATRGAS